MDVIIVVIVGTLALLALVAVNLYRAGSKYDLIAQGFELSRGMETAELLSVAANIRRTTESQKRDADYETYGIRKQWLDSIDPYFRFAGSLLNFAYLTTDMGLNQGMIWASKQVRQNFSEILEELKRALDSRDKRKLYEVLNNFCLLALFGDDYERYRVIGHAPIRNDASTELFNDLDRCADYLEANDPFEAYGCLNSWKDVVRLRQLPSDLILPLLRIRQRVSSMYDDAGNEEWQELLSQLVRMIRRITEALNAVRYDDVIDCLVRDQATLLRSTSAARNSQVAYA